MGQADFHSAVPPNLSGTFTVNLEHRPFRELVYTVYLWLLSVFSPRFAESSVLQLPVIRYPENRSGFTVRSPLTSLDLHVSVGCDDF